MIRTADGYDIWKTESMTASFSKNDFVYLLDILPVKKISFVNLVSEVHSIILEMFLSVCGNCEICTTQNLVFIFRYVVVGKKMNASINHLYFLYLYPQEECKGTRREIVATRIVFRTVWAKLGSKQKICLGEEWYRWAAFQNPVWGTIHGCHTICIIEKVLCPSPYARKLKQYWWKRDQNNWTT